MDPGKGCSEVTGVLATSMRLGSSRNVTDTHLKRKLSVCYQRSELEVTQLFDDELALRLISLLYYFTGNGAPDTTHSLLAP
jgi:hypothetical protein